MKRLEVTCVSPGCPGRHLTEPLDIENLPVPDAFDAIEPYMTRLGWTVDVSPSSGRGFLCPACSAQVTKAMPDGTGEILDTPGVSILAFARRPRCAKCGSRAVGMGHQTGMETAALARCEHLHCHCGICGYRWPMACRDWKEKRPSKPSWFARIFGRKDARR